MHKPGLALVVGGSAGIGLAIAKRFAAHGYDLLLVARDADRLKNAAAGIASDFAATVDTLAVDATKAGAPAQIERAVRSCPASLRYVVVGVGAWHSGSIGETDPATLRQLIDVNAVAPHALQHTLLPLIEDNGGILFVGSLAGCLPLPGIGAYSAAKACLHANVLALREEMSGTGLKVSLLAPGAVLTDFLPYSSKTWFHRMSSLLASSPETVARAAYCGLMANVRVIVPGIVWRIAWLAIRLLPKSFLARLSRKITAAATSKPLDEIPQCPQS